jgi:hypothetical protein
MTILYRAALAVLLVCASSLALHAQESRKYQRKSITSLGVISATRISEEEVQSAVRRALDMPRFDYNTISYSALEAFRKKTSGAKTPEAIEQTLNETVIPEITRAVQSVAEERAKGNLKEEDIARAAAQKMKGTGLTAEDILSVQNAAYLYLTVITRYSEETSEDNAEASIEGYLLWFRVDVSPDGTAKATRMTEGTTVQRGSGVASEKKNGSAKLPEARRDALGSFAQSINLSTKKIPAFQLKSDILSIDAATVSARIGTREGIRLDDGFTAVETVEMANGKQVQREIGFFRVESIADNRQNPDAASMFYPHITRGVERGAILREHPTLGVDFILKPKYFQFNLPARTTPATKQILAQFAPELRLSGFGTSGTGPDFVLAQDVREGYGIDIGIQYNTAPASGVRQLFATLDVGLGWGNASTTQNSGGSVPFLANGYIGVLKKMWLRRVNLQLGGAGGIDGLILFGNPRDNAIGSFESLALVTFGLRFEAGLEWMVSPDFMLNLGAQYKVALPAIVREIRFRTSDTDKPEVVQVPFGTRFFEDISFNGLMFSVGFSASLPSFGSEIPK